MICPHCHSHVADDAQICPACHATLGSRPARFNNQGSFCPSCNAAVAPGEDHCPKCGMQVQRRTRRAPVNTRQEINNTSSLPRIESAIPGQSEMAMFHSKREAMPTRSIIVAAVVALLLIGGFIIFLWHPWDRDLFATRTEIPADTSMEGFPGYKEKLTGQDSSGNTYATVSADETTYNALSDAYDTMVSLSGELDESVNTLQTTAFTGDEMVRREGYTNAQSIAIRISNLITTIQGVDVTSGTYAQAKDDLLTLGNYLRNRSDAVNSAWKLAVDSTDPSGNRTKILAPINGDAKSYAAQFDDALSKFVLDPPASDDGDS